MADFNFDDLRKTITDAAEVVTKKTGDFVSIQKLKGQIYTLERSIDKKYQELGAVVFDEYAKGGKVNDESAVVCEEISQVNANIVELREELASKHGCKVCPVCEAEVPVEAMFCMKCGAQMPEEKCDEATTEDGPTCDDVANEVENVVKEASDAVKKVGKATAKGAKTAVKGTGEAVKKAVDEVKEELKK